MHELPRCTEVGIISIELLWAMDLMNFDCWGEGCICIFKGIVLEADFSDMVLAIEYGFLGLS